MVDKHTTAVDFEQLSELLRKFGALQSASELHGFLVGELATGVRLSRSEWLRTANEQADLSRNPDEVAGDTLYALYQQTLAALSGDELAFQLLLPEDDEPLLDRVEALGQWCQGFLLGFGLSGKHTTDDAELAESLRDLAAIAQVGASEDEAAQDSSESDLFAISEYVRLTVIDIFWQHHEESPPPPAHTPPPPSPASLFQRGKLH